MDTPFHHVVAYDNHEPPSLLERMLKDGNDPNRTGVCGRTPLVLCICPRSELHNETRLKKAELLVKYGADVNQRDSRGWTAAHECAWLGDIPMLRVLSRYGACFSMKNHDKQTPADLAFIKGYRDIYSFLDRHTLSLKEMCRTVVREKMGKRTCKQIDDLPVPPSVKLFVNYNIPYQGWECVAVPEEPWSKEELQTGKVSRSELKQFIEEHSDEAFKSSHELFSNSSLCENKKSGLDDFSLLIEAYQNLFITESFKKISYSEPAARKSRLGGKRFGVIDLAAFESGAMDFLLNEAD